MLLGLGGAVLATSFLSGIFGMLGGLILLGIFLLVLPVPASMSLHAITQMASNGWRAFLWRRHIMKGLLGGYIGGTILVFALFAFFAVSLPKTWVYLFLRLVPFVALSLPLTWAPDINKKGAPFFIGALIMALNVVAGVSGPLLDIFFVRSNLDRRQIVASKAMTQTIGHFFKLAYFSLIVPKPQGPAMDLPLWIYPCSIFLAITGTYSARLVLERMSNHSYQRWSRRLALLIGSIYLFQAVTGLGIHG